MKLEHLLLAAVPLAISLDAATVPAGSSTQQTAYQLDAGAEFQTGCFGPCACPVLIRQGLKGSFRLVHTGFDGLFDHYDVVDAHWRLPGGSTFDTIDGNGTYSVGGEVAVEQQMILDLSVNGAPARRYDSGWVSGGGSFPALDIEIALHGFFCLDSVYVVEASPAVAGVPAALAGSSLLAHPNPFRSATQVWFELDQPRRVDLDVLDVSGRRVRSLAAGSWFPAGARSVAWDGLRDDGRRAASGIYFVRLRSGGRIAQRMLVRL